MSESGPTHDRSDGEHDQLPTGQQPLDGIRGVVFDVGETLVDESRSWAIQAQRAGVTPFTLMGALGALIERDEDHRRVWGILGVGQPDGSPPVEEMDLYSDAIPCLQILKRQGLLLGIAGNQPAGIEIQLRAARVTADFIASSAAWQVDKPSPEFFARIAEAAQLAPREILYVGDRLDNDVLPARAAGMRTAFIRRGPWGHLHVHRPEVEHADLRLESLSELTAALSPQQRTS